MATKQCEFLIDLPFGEVKQCSRQAKIRLTFAPYGTAHRGREEAFYCAQHAKIRQQDFILVAEPQVIGNQG